MVLQSSILKKVIIASLVGLAALGGFYTIENYLKKDIIEAVDQLSEPTHKLILVNNLTASLDQFNVWYQESLQKEKQINIRQLKSRSDTLFQMADSLKVLSANNLDQIVLIDSVIDILNLRNEQLYRYYITRQNQSSLKPLTKELSDLNDILSNDSLSSSTVIENNTNQISKTRIDTGEKEPKKEGFLNRIFGRKKKSQTVVVQEESTYQSSDTVKTEPDSTQLKKAQQIVTSIAVKQQKQQSTLQQSEQSFNQSEKAFNQKINNLVAAIERDIIAQTNTTQSKATGSIKNTLNAIQIIILLFVLASILLIALIVTDITKANKYRQLLEVAKKQAEQESRSKQVLLSNMSHEIRTPLQSILGYSEQWHKQDPENSFNRIIHEAAQHLLEVVNEILAYSSLQTGHFHFEKKAFILQDVLKETKAYIVVQAAKKNLFLNIAPYPEANILLLGDPFRLKQILLNLLNNAVKYTETGSVSLQTAFVEQEESWVCTFTITDTGIGIPEYLHDKIFEQFEQGTADHNQRQAGTGLGLGITKAITEAQGGTIGIQSSSVNGSVFTVTIPFPKASEMAQEQTAAYRQPQPFLGEVWIVDDDGLILKLCRMILEKQQIAHRIFSKAEDMISLLATQTPSLLITDIRMPGLNGYDLAKTVRKTMKNAIPIIAFTANALPNEQNKILEQGFDALLTKPFQEDDLLAIIYKEGFRNAQNYSPEPEKIHIKNPALPSELPDEIKVQFIQDSKEDLVLLKKALAEKDKDGITLLLHRIAGRTMQVGNKQTGMMFRQLEASQVANENEINEEEQLAIQTAMYQLAKQLKNLQ